MFRIAFTNVRIMELKDDKVLFLWKSYCMKLFSKMRLKIDEFTQHFLLHISPKGFFKARSYSIFAIRYRQKNMETTKKLLSSEQQCAKQEVMKDERTVIVKKETVWHEIKELINNFKKFAQNATRGNLDLPT